VLQKAIGGIAMLQNAYIHSSVILFHCAYVYNQSKKILIIFGLKYIYFWYSTGPQFGYSTYIYTH